jgi:eukaryotic-like serine/threonine-protein kinase
VQQQLTKSGTAMGTVAYMSPEQGRGKELDSRTDLFSFGVVLYEMATGILPFQGQTTGEMLEGIFTQQPVAPVRLNPKVPAKLEEIIVKALEKDRTLRYQSAADIRTDLQRLKRDSVHLSVSASSRTNIGRRTWITVAAMLIVLLAVSTFWLVRQRRASQLKAVVPAAATGKTAIAVLPFTNMSADQDQEYFSDGLTEERINALTKNPQLRVTSRTSAFSFKGKEVDIKLIPGKLNVTHVWKEACEKQETS